MPLVRTACRSARQLGLGRGLREYSSTIPAARQLGLCRARLLVTAAQPPVTGGAGTSTPSAASAEGAGLSAGADGESALVDGVTQKEVRHGAACGAACGDEHAVHTSQRGLAGPGVLLARGVRCGSVLLIEHQPGTLGYLLAPVA